MDSWSSTTAVQNGPLVVQSPSPRPKELEEASLAMDNQYISSSPVPSIDDLDNEADASKESPIFYLGHLEHTVKLRDFQRALRNLVEKVKDYDEFEKIYDDSNIDDVQRWTALADIYTKRIQVACHLVIAKCGDMDILNKALEFFDMDWNAEELVSRREQMDAFVRTLRLEAEERLCDMESDEAACSEEKLRDREMELIGLYLESIEGAQPAYDWSSKEFFAT